MRLTTRTKALVAFAAAVGCLLTAVLLPAPADAAHGGLVQVQVGGAPFTATPTGSLFRIAGLVPGQSTSAELGVRSGIHGDTALWLQVVDVHDDDNGCTVPEALVDASCGAGQGELGSALRFTVAAADNEGGPFSPTWTGSGAALASGTWTGVALAPAGTRWLRLTAALPADTGNEVQGDTFSFALSVELRATSGVAGVSVGPRSTDGSAGTTSAAAGVDGLAASRPPSAGLAYTGASITLLVVGGVLLLLAGVLVIRTNRRRTGQT